MRRKPLLLLASLAVVAYTCVKASAHCQIPCGIYDDPARFTALEEHVTTIEKSMKQIQELSKEQPPNWNQLVRWVGNKEAHTDQLTEIVTFYFMAQRIKLPDRTDRAAQAKYARELTLLHQMVVHAMKAKQTTDLELCAKLRELIGKLKASYLRASGGTGAASYSHPHPHPHR